MSFSSNDQASDGPDPDDQKVRLHAGTTGAKMVSQEPSVRGTPANDNLNNSSSSSSNNINHTPIDEHRQQINYDDYSGLQVVEAGLEVPHSALPEVLPPSLPEARYAEHDGYNKAWADGHSPSHQHHKGGGGGYPFPEAVSPSDHHPYPPYSKASSATYNGGHNPFSPTSDGDKGQQHHAADGRVCGMRKMIFWCVLAVAVFVVVVGVAVGLGVGLGTRDDSSANSTSTATSTVDNPLLLPAATASAAASASTSIVCPSANRTVYTLESSSKSFLVLCGRDYNSCCGAVDMLTVNTSSFESCLEQCSGQEGCIAVGWGNYYGTNTCWLKSAWGEPNWSGSWYVGVMVNATV
ncbi:hypothetical protein diail_7106 [Diaporthe ilicicola]|nr:hypothetical protein diail_7106 [Diaporthe ilicicola]